MDKQAFLESAARPTKTVQINGFEMVIESLSLRQREELPNRIAENSANGVAWIVVSGVRDFDEEDMEAVSNIDHEVLEQIANEVLLISGLSPDAGEEAKND